MDQATIKKLEALITLATSIPHERQDNSPEARSAAVKACNIIKDNNLLSILSAEKKSHSISNTEASLNFSGILAFTQNDAAYKMVKRFVRFLNQEASNKRYPIYSFQQILDIGIRDGLIEQKNSKYFGPHLRRHLSMAVDFDGLSSRRGPNGGYFMVM